MPPDNRSPKSRLWPAGEASECWWLTRTKRGVPLLFWNCQPQPWDLGAEDETVTLTTRSKGLKHDKCDYNIQESHLGRQGKRQSEQDIQLFITLGRAGSFKAEQLTATSRRGVLRSFSNSNSTALQYHNLIQLRLIKSQASWSWQVRDLRACCGMEPLS